MLDRKIESASIPLPRSSADPPQYGVEGRAVLISWPGSFTVTPEYPCRKHQNFDKARHQPDGSLSPSPRELPALRCCLQARAQPSKSPELIWKESLEGRSSIRSAVELKNTPSITQTHTQLLTGKHWPHRPPTHAEAAFPPTPAATTASSYMGVRS